MKMMTVRKVSRSRKIAMNAKKILISTSGIVKIFSG
jgi:hypothetical protein